MPAARTAAQLAYDTDVTGGDVGAGVLAVVLVVAVVACVVAGALVVEVDVGSESSGTAFVDGVGFVELVADDPPSPPPQEISSSPRRAAARRSVLISSPGRP